MLRDAFESLAMDTREIMLRDSHISLAMDRGAELLVQHKKVSDALESVWCREQDNLLELIDEAHRSGNVPLVSEVVLATCTAHGAAKMLRRANKIKHKEPGGTKNEHRNY